MRTIINEIAKKHMLEFVHPTQLNRFVSEIIEHCAQDLELNGYDDAARQLRTKITDDTNL